MDRMVKMRGDTMINSVAAVACGLYYEELQVLVSIQLNRCQSLSMAVNRGPGDFGTVCLCPFPLVSRRPETSLQEFDRDPSWNSIPGRRSVRASVSVYPVLLPSRQTRRAAYSSPRGKLTRRYANRPSASLRSRDR